MKVITTVFLLSFLLPGCAKQVPPVSNFKVEELDYARAAIFEADTWDVLDSVGSYASGVLDSVELKSDDARAAVTILLDGGNYILPEQVEPSSGGFIAYGAACHNPHFLLLAYDKEGRQTNMFTVCFNCGNVRMKNYRKYPVFDELVISPKGDVAFMDLQNRLFPAYEGTRFWDPYRSLKIKRQD